MADVRILPIQACRLRRPWARRPALVHATAFLGMLAGVSAVGQGPAPPPPATAAGEQPKAAGERVKKLTTSDGFDVAGWYYPAERPETADAGPDAPPAPVVILLHDLDGSHKSVEPLALELQSRGIAVVAPDLRGHGATMAPAGREVDAKMLKKQDFEKMTLTGGGRVRDQATVYGEVEAVRNWVKDQAEAGKIDMNKLVVVGVGVGGAVAAHWTVADAMWPDLASGPQGRQVRGLVLVSPAWVTRGFTISQPLAAEVLRRSLPVLVIGGAQDADAVKLYDQLKRQRPKSWSEKLADQATPTQAPELARDAQPSLYLRQFDNALSGDRLAAYVPKDRRGGHPAAIIEGFIGAVTAPEP